MLTTGLSTDQAPPIRVPMIFFATAPLFGLAAAALLVFYGGGTELQSRWSPLAMVLTHLLLPGFVVTVMFGAVQQMLPVVAGATIKHPVAVSHLVHAFWVAGVASLGAGFFWSELGGGQLLLRVAAVALACAGAVYLVAAGDALRRANAANETVLGMRLAHICLALVLIFGVTLALGRSGVIPVYRHQLTDTHALFALGGWIVLLIMAVSYQVVPMFFVTPTYPVWAKKWLCPAVFGGLVLHALPSKIGSLSGLIFTFCAVFLYAILSLRLMLRRRRKVPDPALLLWRVALGSLMLVDLIWLTHEMASALTGFTSAVVYHVPVELVRVGFGIFIFGFAISIVIAMLSKIMPFLVWFHLQGIQMRKMMAGTKGMALRALPTMKEILPDSLVRKVIWLHLSAGALLLVSIVWPAQEVAWGIAMAGCYSLLLHAVWRCILVFRKRVNTL